MSEENKAHVRRFLEELDKKNFAISEEMATPSTLFYYPGSEPLNRETVQGFYNVFYSAFPDLQHTIDEQIAEGDKVVTRTTLRGTHNGDLQGIAPTGKQVTIEAILIDHMVGDKMGEHRASFDQLGLMQQLGVIPSQG